MSNVRPIIKTTMKVKLKTTEQLISENQFKHLEQFSRGMKNVLQTFMTVVEIVHLKITIADV